MTSPTDPAPAPPTGSTDRAPHCTSCGRPQADCPGCARTLDPDRFCVQCGTRLAVRVSPGGWVGRCKFHGEVARS